MKTLREKIEEAIGQDDLTKIKALYDVVKYHRNEPATYWKAAIVEFNVDFSNLPNMEDVVMWMENEVATLEVELMFAKLTLDMLKS